MATSEPAELRLRTALADDLDAGFAELVRVHGSVVYSVARALVRSADAEDLASESLLRAYRALRGYAPARIATLAVRPWLLAIVRNTARNAARDAARRPAPPPAFDPPERAADTRGPAQLAEQADDRRSLAAVLAELPENQRAAVVLRHVVGLPTSEVAQVLGCPDGTAKSYISRGLRRLRTLLTEPAPAGTAQRVAMSGRRSS